MLRERRADEKDRIYSSCRQQLSRRWRNIEIERIGVAFSARTYEQVNERAKNRSRWQEKSEQIQRRHRKRGCAKGKGSEREGRTRARVVIANCEWGEDRVSKPYDRTMSRLALFDLDVGLSITKIYTVGMFHLSARHDFICESSRSWANGAHCGRNR